MAIFRPGPTITAISGALGGQIYRAGKKGPVIQIRPRRRKTLLPLQTRNNAQFVTLTHLWRNLTDDQRRQWRNAAALLKQRNRLGVSRPLSGFNLFVHTNRGQVSFDTGAWTPYSPEPTSLQKTVITSVTNWSTITESNSAWVITVDGTPGPSHYTQVWCATDYTPGQRLHPRNRRLIAQDGGTLPDNIPLRPPFEAAFGPPAVGQPLRFEIVMQTWDVGPTILDLPSAHYVNAFTLPP